MDSRIWSNLPEDLQDKILAMLPVKSFLPLRCVCKRWYNLLKSPCFLSLCSKQSAERPWLVMVKRQDETIIRAHDVFRDKWYTLPLNFLPCTVVEIVAASGGLLCLKSNYSLIVCNPLTKIWKEFPFSSLDNNNLCAVTMTSIKGTPGYKILIAVSTPGKTAYVYDSITSQWSTVKDFPLRAPLKYDATYCDGMVYFNTSEPLGIIAFNLDTHEWFYILAPLPPNLTCNRLVSCGNKLYLVGGVGANGISKSFGVWELSQDRTEWTEVQKLPEMMCKKFLALCYHNYDHIYCVGHDDLICLSCFTWPEVLVYKLSRRTWHWLPRCPLISEKSRCVLKWFSLNPSVYDLP
eukprot:TRINITY_DN17705_c0_g1_i1.p1 TRINITY_DN17705_c0_g1~~TRINITY_DN17705_c0_g1_i1.p1  ORF type:complete len:349 (-),score=34.99 TRINITY_DN17705_c0_g1_i1:547-1593(-)